MTRPHLAAHSLGAFTPGATSPRTGPQAFRELLARVGTPVSVVEVGGRPAIVEGGVASLGGVVGEGQLPLLGHAPALTPERLGDRTFTQTYGLSAPLIAGEMANGIASEAMVEAVSRAGCLGVFGAAGLTVPRVMAAIDRLSTSLAGLPWGINLIHSPDDQKLEAELVERFLARGLRIVSASAYLDLTLPVVRYRTAGIHRDASGAVVVPNRLIAKVSRVEVAKKFLEPAPERFLTELVAKGQLTAEQAELARHVPMADDVTAEADSGGHTDNRPLVLLLPALQALRDELSAQHGYLTRPRIGAAGGIATPASVASAFAMGAAYVVTGSVNQATKEAGTSDAVRALLAQAGPTDVAMAPAADMFELGVKVQVLTRGTLFAVRAQRLYELYRTHASLEALPAAVREELETRYFRSTLDDAWASCVRFFTERDPAQLERAAKEPKHRMALIFRAYLGQASKWANAGVADRTLDYQVWCGPSMGAFNAWVKGSHLEPWIARDVVSITRNLLVGACALTRAAALRSQGVVLPAEVEAFAPRTLAELDVLVKTADVAAPSPVERVPSEDATAPRVKEPIAIIGMGSLFPKANSLEEFWRLLRTGVDATGEVPSTHWSLSDYFDPDLKAPDKTYGQRGAFLSATNFDPTEFGIPPSILEATDTSQLLSLVVARMALEDAGYGEDVSWDRARASVLLGVTGTQELVINLGARLGHPKWKKALKDAGVDEATAKDVVERISSSYVGWQENSFPGLLGNVVAGRIANRFDLGGTNCVVDAACASSLGALHLAIAELESKRQDLVLTGGVDTLNDIFMHMCFSKTPALSATGDARPFSDQADGTLLGEGIGMLVLKRLADAERDGDRIYAVIRGLGTSSDGRAKSIYAPLPKGQARALKAAYVDANVCPRDIALLEAHGTGTKAGDAAEFEALEAVYREDSADPAWCALGSVKSQIGHTKAAAGAAGLIKAALALHHRVLPPTLKIDRPNPALKLDTSPFAVSGVSRPWLTSPRGPRLAAVSSFGFGGSNFHTVLEEYGAQRGAPAWDGSVELVALSGHDVTALKARVGEAIAAKDVASFAAASRASFRTQDAHRLVAVVQAGASLDSVFGKLTFERPFVTNDVAYGVGAVAGKLAFVFPGQGSQHVDMLRELACVFPEVLQAVDAQPTLAKQIYPLPTFDEAEKTRREQVLTRTDVAQPAIGAVSRGLLEVLGRFGVAPALVAGHSYGELVALHAAGVLSVDGLEKASKVRGELMAGDGSDRGTMLAVLAPLEQIERLIVDEHLDLVLANRNGPSQGVLSGDRASIAKAEAACQRKGLRATRLNVGAAFHSPLVSGAATQFSEALERVEFEAPRVPVIANTTGAAYPADAAAAKLLLANQLAKPVRFDEVIERLYSEGARTFVEVGPRAALTGMVKAILTTRAHSAMAVDAPGRRGGVFELGLVLARLAAEGHPVKLEAWQQVQRPPRWKARPARVPKMAVPLTGANYRSPVTAKPVVAVKARPSTVPVPPPPMAVAQPVQTPAPRLQSASNTTSGAVSVLQSPAVRAPSSSALTQYQDNLRALQALQEQTARLHQSFLDGQLAAQQNLAALMLGQPMPVAVSVPVAPVAPTPGPSTHVPAPTVVALPPARKVAEVASNGVHHSNGVSRSTVVAAPKVDTRATLLSTVAELTGYPAESLSLEMDLEADLGIDSIKRVEILSLLSRRIPGAPSVNPEKLGGLKTLAQVHAFIEQGTAGAPVPASVQPALDVRGTLLTTVAELTGYPAESLSLEMDLEADLGIDSIKRVEILSLLSRRIPGAPSVNPEKLGGLKTLAQVLAFTEDGASSSQVAPSAPVAVVPAGIDSKGILLATVAELTGYPAETLSLQMDLEADLGIDSIKRVEILSLLSRRIPGAPSVNPEKLSGLKTLAQVQAFIDQGAVQAPAQTVGQAPSADAASVLLATVSELTGYPLETLSLQMDLEADLGIDSIKRVEILSLLSRRIPDAPSVNPEKLSGLRTLQQVLSFVSGTGLASTPIEPSVAPAAPSSPRVAQSSALDGPSSPPQKRPSTLGVVPEQVAADSVLRRVVAAVRAPAVTGATVRLPAAKILIGRDDGGLAEHIAKAFERVGQAAEVIDPGAAIAGSVGGLVLIAPTTSAWDESSEQSLKHALQTARSVSAALRATPGAFLVTISRRDGAFGFSASATLAHPLAAGLIGLAHTLKHEWPEVRCRTFDVAPVLSLEDAASAVVDELTNDGPAELGIGAAGRLSLGLRESVVSAGPLPVKAGDVVVVTGGARGVTADCARELALQTGVTLLLLGRSPAPELEPQWLSSAVDEASIKRVLLERAPAGQRPSPRQLAESSRQVLAARDIRATLQSLSALGLKATYRQVDVRDVGAVSEVLAEARQTLGSITGVVHGAGVLRDKRIEDKRDDDFDQVLDPKLSGLRAVLEATRADELKVIALFASVTGRFGRKGQADYAVANQALVSIAQAESVKRPSCRVVALDWGPWAGGMVTPALEAAFRKEGVSLIPLEAGAKAFVDELRVAPSGPREVVLGAGFGAALDSAWTLVRSERLERSWPVLADHRLNGREVLPLAMTLEWFTSAARALADGKQAVSIEDVRVLRGVTMTAAFEDLSVWAGPAEHRGDEVVFPLELRNLKDHVHVRAQAVLGDSKTPVVALASPSSLSSFGTSMSELYASQLFHGPSLWTLSSIEGLTDEGMALTLRSRPTSERLISGPSRRWSLDPLAIDGVFQALIVWSRARLGAPSLPSKVGSVRVFAALPDGEVRAVVRVRSVEGPTVTSDVDLLDGAGAVLVRLEGYQCTVSSTLARAFEADASAVQQTPAA